MSNYINHVALVLDASSSMGGLTSNVIKVIDNQIKFLAKSSKDLNQETRVSIYSFADKVKNLAFDKDVLRLPSIADIYEPYGSTALIDGLVQTMEDLKKTATMYGEHSFLIFCVTDGEENRSFNTSATLSKMLKDMPDNWTVGVLVPGVNGVAMAKRYGIPAQCIQVWDTTAKGMEEVGEVIQNATTSFMQGRAKGIRGTKNLFSVNVANLNTNVIKSALQEIKASEYEILPVRKDAVIKDYVELFTKNPYRQGSAYYELSKKEKVQAAKQIAIQNKLNGKVYSGLNARSLLGLPQSEVNVAPADFGEWNVFIQSTSTNRKLIKGTNLLVLK